MKSAKFFADFIFLKKGIKNELRFKKDSCGNCVCSCQKFTRNMEKGSFAEKERINPPIHHFHY